MAKLRLTESNRRLIAWMILAGIVVGLVFPWASSFFVEFKSTAGLIGFLGLCVIAGVMMAAMCFWVATKTSQRQFRAVLEEVSVEFTGFETMRGGSSDQMQQQLMGVLTGVGSMLDHATRVNSDIRALTAEVLAATEEQASGAAQQAAAVTETSATVEELAQTSKQIADNSGAVVGVAERTLASAEEGMESLDDTKAGIEEIRQSTQQSSDRILALGERSQEIGRVLTIIDDIAEQTKILALNAAIEAARAGEAGKGFAVVAEEIRKLADSVTESTQEIGRVVREIQTSTSQLIMSTERAAKKVDEGGLLALSTADSLDKIVSQVEETTDAAKQISIATQQQRTASDQVVLSMKEVAQVSQQAAETSRQIAAAMTDLNGLADSLLSR